MDDPLVEFRLIRQTSQSADTGFIADADTGWLAIFGHHAVSDTLELPLIQPYAVDISRHFRQPPPSAHLH